MGNRRIERAFGGIGGIEMLYKFSSIENFFYRRKFIQNNYYNLSVNLIMSLFRLVGLFIRFP